MFRSFGVHILPSQFRGVERPDLVISGSTGPAVHHVAVVYVEPDGRERGAGRRLHPRGGQAAAAREPQRPARHLRRLPPGRDRGSRRGGDASRPARDGVDREARGGADRPARAGPRPRKPARRASPRIRTTRPWPSSPGFRFRSAADGREARRGVRTRRSRRTASACCRRCRAGPSSTWPTTPRAGCSTASGSRLYCRSLAPREPAGREPAGEVRLPYPPAPGRRAARGAGERPRARRGPLRALRRRRPMAMPASTSSGPTSSRREPSGSCGAELPPAGAFGRKHPERVAARGYGFLNDAPAATRHSVMTGFARANVDARRGDLRGLRGPKARGARHARARGREASACGSRSCRAPPAAVPWLEVVAYDAQGRELSRERQRG